MFRTVCVCRGCACSSVGGAMRMYLTRLAALPPPPPAQGRPHTEGRTHGARQSGLELRATRTSGVRLRRSPPLRAWACPPLALS